MPDDKDKTKKERYYDTSKTGMPAGDPGGSHEENEKEGMPGGAAATTAGVLDTEDK